jgi:tripartite ATP-independent transporter DctM subunit
VTALLGAMLLLMLLGMPVFAAIGIACAGYLVASGAPPVIAVQQMFAGIDQFPLLAVPFFVLAGNLMNASVITDRIFRFASAACGHIRGGLGHVNVFASLIFSGMSGTAVADAGGLGTIELKAMRDAGFDVRFAVGVTAASATLGPIIPPSLPLVVYGASAATSIGQLFVAGIIPGLLVALCLHAMIWWMAGRRNYPREPWAGWPELGDRLRGALPALLTPGIILGGMVAGIFTPTEAAVVAALYALALDGLLYRRLTWHRLSRVLFETFETTAVIMILVAVSTAFGWILIREGTPQRVAHLMLGIAHDATSFLLAASVLLLFCGMFLDTIVIVLLATPLLLPAMQGFGIDPVQFGIVMVLNLMIGLMTPPVGLLLFVLSRIAGLDVWATTKACFPFMLPLLVVLVAICLYPPLTLALPIFFFR